MRVITMGSYLLLLLPFSPLALTAAPAPKENDDDKLRRIHGDWTDPDKDCKYVLKGGELRISLPKTDHRLYSGNAVERPKTNAPRVLREVNGDFTFVVRVMFPLPEVPKAAPGWPYCSGGLVAWESDARFLVIRRAGGLTIGDSEGIITHHAAPVPVTSIQTFGNAKPTESAFIRLKREGKKVAASWSRDAKTWKEFEPVEVGWRSRVKVGIVAENTLGTPVELTFDQYSLTLPKK